MNLNKWMLPAAFLALTSTTWASPTTKTTTNVYFGGFEDLVNGDYDYNDIVFSLSGAGLTLNTSTGQWHSEPVLGTSGSPFWNHASNDGPEMNIGYCIYGGGNCGSALDPSAKYLATSTGKSVSDVYFSVNRDQDVDADIYLKIAADNDKIGYYLLSNPYKITWLASTDDDTYAFDPGSQAFGIAAENTATGDIFYSDTNVSGPSFGTYDRNGNHFAWFSDAPEPAEWSLMGAGLIALGLIRQIRRRPANNVNVNLEA